MQGNRRKQFTHPQDGVLWTEIIVERCEQARGSSRVACPLDVEHVRLLRRSSKRTNRLRGQVSTLECSFAIVAICRSPETVWIQKRLQLSVFGLRRISACQSQSFTVFLIRWQHICYLRGSAKGASLRQPRPVHLFLSSCRRDNTTQPFFFFVCFLNR